MTLVSGQGTPLRQAVQQDEPPKPSPPPPGASVAATAQIRRLLKDNKGLTYIVNDFTTSARDLLARVVKLEDQLARVGKLEEEQKDSFILG